jgi:hypothetical protein
MTPADKTTKFEAHLREIANIAKRIGEQLDLKADAQQACFATILISADKHGVFFDVAHPEMTETAHDRAAAAKADAQTKDIPRHPSPEEAETGALTALKEGVKKACRLLNAEGLTPPLRPATIDAYIQKETELKTKFTEMDSEDLEALLKNLNFKLDDLKSKKKSREDDAGF